MKKILFKSIFLRPALIAAVIGFILQACSGTSPYLVPEKTGYSDLSRSGGDKVDIQIRPVFTSGVKSEDKEYYRSDFSQYFSPIEVHLHNGTQDPVEWDPLKSVLKDSQEKEFHALNEEEAFNYYRRGDLLDDSFILLEKPYEQQKEDLENIKRFILKPSLISPGKDIKGLLLFKKVALNQCEKVLLVIAGIKIGHQENKVNFPLTCPGE